MTSWTIRRVGCLGHEHVEPVLVAQPTNIEVLLHRIRGRQQADAADTPGTDGVGRRVGDVDERDVNGAGDGIADLVHRVGAEHEQLGAGAYERPRLASEQRARLLPAAGTLELLDVGEVDRTQQAVGGVQTAEPLAGRLVDQPVVLRGGLPAHSAQQADSLHSNASSKYATKRRSYSRRCSRIAMPWWTSRRFRCSVVGRVMRAYATL